MIVLVRIACLLMLGMICTGAARSQSLGQPAHRIPAHALQADFAIFKRAYEQLHPGLYRYNTKTQMDVDFRVLQSQLSHDLTLREAYLAFATFLAKIKCGHTYPNFFNQPDAVADALFKHQDRVPFYFRWIDRRMVVTRNFSTDHRLMPGSEVTSINGVAVGRIRRALMTVSRADGSNDAKRLSNLEVSGDSRYEAFDIYFPMLFPPKSDRMVLSIKTPNRYRSIRVCVKALTYEQRLAPIEVREAARHGGDQPLWEFKPLDKRTALLRMPNWALFDSKWDWKAFLDKTFEQLAQDHTSNLVIDLRGNEGGLSVGDVILSKLVRQDLRLRQYKRWVRYRKIPDALSPYLDTWDRSFRDWGNAAVGPHNGFYRLTQYDDDSSGMVIKASSHPFRGRTYVLVDASNSSATFEFAQALQQHRLATLVGQPTGGNQRGINGGAFFFLRLPNSKIETDLPLIGQYPSDFHPSAVSPSEIRLPDAGLKPDISIQPRRQDIQRGVDTELTALLQRLRTRS